MGMKEGSHKLCDELADENILIRIKAINTFTARFRGDGVSLLLSLNKVLMGIRINNNITNKNNVALITKLLVKITEVTHQNSNDKVNSESTKDFGRKNSSV